MTCQRCGHTAYASALSCPRCGSPLAEQAGAVTTQLAAPAGPAPAMSVPIEAEATTLRSALHSTVQPVSTATSSEPTRVAAAAPQAAPAAQTSTTVASNAASKATTPARPTPPARQLRPKFYDAGPIENHRVWAIVSCVVGGIFGIVALLMSFKVDTLAREGKRDAARLKAKQVRTLCIVGNSLAIGIVLFYFIFFLILASSIPRY